MPLSLSSSHTLKNLYFESFLPNLILLSKIPPPPPPNPKVPPSLIPFSSCGTNIFFFFSFSNLVHSLPTQVARPYEVRLLGGPTWHSGLIPFQPPGSYLSHRSERKKKEKAAQGGLISMGLVQKTQDSAILVILQLLQICSRCKRRELELSKQFISMTFNHLFSPFILSSSFHFSISASTFTLLTQKSIASSLPYKVIFLLYPPV